MERKVCCFFVVCFVLIPVCVVAQGGEAYTVPISDTRIILDVEIPGLEVTTIAIFEGGMIRITTPEGKVYGLVPGLQNDNSEILLSVQEINKVESGETMTELELKQNAFGADISFEAMSMKVRAVEAFTRTPDGKKWNVTEDCCVQCPPPVSFKFCGLAVKGSCGCCCDPGHCGTEEDPFCPPDEPIE
jgi:hypothetical protein